MRGLLRRAWLFARVARLETLMSTVHDDIATLQTNYSALKAHVISTDAKLASLTTVAPGQTISDEDAATLATLASDSSAIVAGFTPAATEPTSTEAPAPTDATATDGASL